MDEKGRRGRGGERRGIPSNYSIVQQQQQQQQESVVE
jgi:hypothetical protein